MGPIPLVDLGDLAEQLTWAINVEAGASDPMVWQLIETLAFCINKTGPYYTGPLNPKNAYSPQTPLLAQNLGWYLANPAPPNSTPAKFLDSICFYLRGTMYGSYSGFGPYQQNEAGFGSLLGDMNPLLQRLYWLFNLGQTRANHTAGAKIWNLLVSLSLRLRASGPVYSGGGPYQFPK